LRLICTALAALALVLSASAQVWDKQVVPGLVYHMEYDATLPRQIHALRYSPSIAKIKALPELALGTVFSDDDSKGRETVSAMVARTGAIAGINGDYFPFTGDPLGLMVREGQLLSQPVKPRAAFAWGTAGSGIGLINWQMTMAGEGMDPLDLDGIDEQCGQNACVVNDPVAGLAISQKPAVCVVLKPDKAALGASGQFSGVVQSVFSDVTSVPVGMDSLLVMGHGTKAGYLNALKPGQRVLFNVQTQGLDWSKYTNAIGGGPMLVQNGHAFVDWQEEGFKADFAQKRHPRTAIGRTQEGDVWMVAVDGRQAGSAGATLDEMAAIMLRLGCVDAINLDGGGSTDINALGMTLNRPTDGKEPGERKVANGLLLFAEDPVMPSAETLKIAGPAKLLTSDTPDFTVTTSDDFTLPNTDIIWAATGPAFIDQGGRLHILGPGVVNLLAHVHGQLVTGAFTIELPPPAPVETAKPGK
jgi:hypothetical protein